jgi:DsbC/DsbD-like thiol-disulfide interchange protein
MLEANENPALARTLLERYTRESLPTPQAWRAWLTKSRDKLFFLDSHGYRFFTDAPSAPPAKWQTDEALAALKVAEPINIDPVATGATIVSRYGRNGVATAYPGDVVTLVVRIRVAEPWHTYAKVPADSAMKPTAIDVKLPDGLRFVGDWKVPTAKASDTPGTTVYEGDLLFSRDVLVTAKTGSLTVAGAVQFQACDPERCQPPRTEPLSLRMQITDR